MNAMTEQNRQAAAVSLAAVLYPDADRPAATDAAYHGQYVEGLGTPLLRPSQGGVFSRLLRSLIEWVAAFRERRAVTGELSRMSDRDLADIGLSRAQIHSVFDPEFVQARDTPYRAAGDLGDRALGDLSLSRALPRPTAGR